MQQMKKEGVRPDIHTYTSFINASCKAGDLQVFYNFARSLEIILFQEILFFHHHFELLQIKYLFHIFFVLFLRVLYSTNGFCDLLCIRKQWKMMSFI